MSHGPKGHMPNHDDLPPLRADVAAQVTDHTRRTVILDPKGLLDPRDHRPYRMKRVDDVTILILPSAA